MTYSDPMPRHFPEDRQKFKELILYISQELASDENYGKTRLAKALFFIDYLAYAKFGKPVTGVECIREEHGPVPQALRDGARSPFEELLSIGDLELRETVLPRNMVRQTPVAKRPPDLSLFSEDELTLAKDVIESFRGWLGGTVSKYTHQWVGWQSVPLGEVIPYETIFISPNQKLNARETQRAQEFARERGWLKKSGR